MVIDDIKANAKNEKQLQSILHIIHILSKEISMEFRTENCALRLQQ